MSPTRFAGFFMFAAVVLTIHASAATFTDDMLSVQNTAETRYYGLRPFTGASDGLSDMSSLTFSSAAYPLGHAIYRVNGAEEATVGIYTAYGTCVSQKDGQPVLGTGGSQALWSWPENAVYAGFGGGLWQIKLDNRMYPAFSQSIAAIPTSAIGYGLNVYASSDDNSFSHPLSAYLSRSVSESLCYEEYTIPIPVSAKFIKVEINDVTSFPTGDGEIVQNRLPARLASVRISGAALVMGAPAEVVQQQTAVAQSSASASDKSAEEEEKISIKAHAAHELSEETETEKESADKADKKSSSSKFEGTITSSSKTEKKASSKSNNTKAPDEPSQESSLSESVSEFEPTHDAVYEIRREKSGGLLNSGVTAYIIIVTGALVLLLIFGRKH